MATWTTVAEYYGYLRKAPPDVGSPAEAWAQQALDAAAGTIENEAGQLLGESTDTIVRDGKGGTELIVPRWPVTAVTSVTLLDPDGDTLLVADTDYTWAEYGAIERLGSCWPKRKRSVEVVYTAGYAEVSLDLKRIAWRLAATAGENPTGLESEKIGDWSGKWKSDVVAGEVTAADRRVISRYQAYA